MLLSLTKLTFSTLLFHAGGSRARVGVHSCCGSMVCWELLKHLRGGSSFGVQMCLNSREDCCCCSCCSRPRETEEKNKLSYLCMLDGSLWRLVRSLSVAVERKSHESC
ncbi:unnamed protein product [Musa acuminata subsp. burmannicoides]